MFSPAFGADALYHWRVAGTVHGLAFTGEASVYESTSTWHMECDLPQDQRLILSGTWRNEDHYQLLFHTSYADADVLFAPELLGLPSKEMQRLKMGNLSVLTKTPWKQLSSTVDLHFTTIEPY